MNSDDSLISDLIRGDHSALDALYKRYGRLLYSVAFQITRDSGSAEEVLQDSFFQLWQKACQFDSERGSLIGWLLTITRHRAISCVRGRDFGQTFDESDMLEVRQIGSSVLEHEIARQLISRALSGLSEVQREAITRAYFEGMTCEEIAVDTNAPLGTIKTRLRTGLRSMKSTLSSGRKTVSFASSRRADATLEDILITDQLFSRVCRQRRPEEETEALRVLREKAPTTPNQLINLFLGLSVDLCNAGTAGLSLLEKPSGGAQVFRWANLAGKLAKHVGGTTPRNFSPCGVTLDCNAPQLFSYPGRHFKYFNDVDVPIVEGLVIPFHVDADTEGTVWIVSHEETTRFDSDDARIMGGLTEFVACALGLAKSMEITDAARRGPGPFEQGRSAAS